MKQTFLIADLHLGHAGVCKFLRKDGSKLRPWDSADDMDQEIIQRWNATVGPTDKVYILGDVAIARKNLVKCAELNGDKVLIKGNHDIFRLNDYTPYFRDIRGYHVMAGMILSHIPVHPDSKSRFKANIHGHLHDSRVMLGGEIDPWYYCVSAEHTDYTPVSFDVVVEQIKQQSQPVMEDL